MSLEIDKAKTYVGFAIKSGAIKYGVDDICKCKKSELIVLSDALKESSTNKVLSFATKNHKDLLKLSLDDFEKLLDNNSVKAIAILDKNLALAIKKNLTNL